MLNLNFHIAINSACYCEPSMLEQSNVLFHGCFTLFVLLVLIFLTQNNSVEDILQVLIVFCVESLELDFALLYPERHTLLRVLPVLVVLATSSEKESESLYKRVKINRLLSIFKV